MSNLLSRINTRGRRRAAVSGFSFTVNGAAQSTADGTSYTFNTVDIGTEATGRRVLVAISTTDNGASMAITGVTIGGNAAPVFALATTNTNASNTCFAVLQVDSGTTTNIVVTLDADGALDMAIQVYALYGLSSDTPADTAVAAGTTGLTLTNSIDCPAGGAIFGVVAWRDPGAAVTTSWDLTTEVSDAYHDAQHSYSFAYQSYVAAQTALSVTATANQAPAHSSMSLISYG